MALLGYAGEKSYLRVDGLEIKNTEIKTVIMNITLYTGADKNQKIWSTNLQYMTKPSFRGNAQCETVQSLNDVEQFLSSASDNVYALCDSKLYRKVQGSFEKDVGLPGELILNKTDNKWYVLGENGLWVPASPDVFTEDIYEKFFSVKALDTANPFKKAYEFLSTQSQFSHCVADE